MSIADRTHRRGWTRSWLLQDWAANDPAIKIRILMVSYRAAQAPPRPLAKPTRLLYRLFSDWLLGIELPWQVVAGPELRIDHGHALVVHPEVRFGAGCKLRHGVTVGQAKRGGPVPLVGDNVDFGAGAVVVGRLVVGNDSTIGANAVVVRDVPPGRVAVGNPARIL